MQKKLSFEESCNRPCGLRLTICGGPTACGLDGYACENCLIHIRNQFLVKSSLHNVNCGYCGAVPSYVAERGVPVCELCAKNAVETVQNWYKRT
jgi:hypothetical protein